GGVCGGSGGHGALLRRRRRRAGHPHRPAPRRAGARRLPVRRHADPLGQRRLPRPGRLACRRPGRLRRPDECPGRSPGPARHPFWRRLRPRPPRPVQQRPRSRHAGSCRAGRAAHRRDRGARGTPLQHRRRPPLPRAQHQCPAGPAGRGARAEDRLHARRRPLPDRGDGARSPAGAARAAACAGPLVGCRRPDRAGLRRGPAPACTMNARLARAALLPACAVLVLLVWWPAMAGPFQFDDWWLVVANPATGGVGGWWQSLPGIRPLLKLSLALNAELAPAPWSYRAFNLAVHLGNAALVALLMARLLPVLAPAHPRPPLAALATALLFALHPATTEAVSYVSGRSISLMALPYLGALALIAGAPRDGRRADLAAALLFALALAVRETAVTLPAAAALVLRFKGESFRGIVWRLRWHLIVLGLALLAAALTPAY